MDIFRKTTLSRYPAVLRWTIRMVTGLLVLSLMLVLPFRWLDPPISSIMTQHWIKAAIQDRKPFRIGYRWTDWNRIQPHMALAVIASEDQRFLDHSGFDFDAIADALEEQKDGGRLRGASTITQQVAKNLYLWPGKSFFRKGLEAYFTLLLETLWPKRRILEVYLNIAEFGDGVYGIGSASRLFFDKSPGRLTLWECSRLAAVLPSPKRMNPAKPSAYVISRSVWIQNQMQRMGGPGVLDRMGL